MKFLLMALLSLSVVSCASNRGPASVSQDTDSAKTYTPADRMK